MNLKINNNSYISIDCHQHDIDWVKKKFMFIPKNLRADTAKKYSIEFNNHNGDLKEVGRARRLANTKLLRYVNKLKGK